MDCGLVRDPFQNRDSISLSCQLMSRVLGTKIAAYFKCVPIEESKGAIASRQSVVLVVVY
jgi:hypothetical protein